VAQGAGLRAKVTKPGVWLKAHGARRTAKVTKPGVWLKAQGAGRMFVSDFRFQTLSSDPSIRRGGIPQVKRSLSEALLPPACKPYGLEARAEGPLSYPFTFNLYPLSFDL
jgi:hypothetical protein